MYRSVKVDNAGLSRRLKDMGYGRFEVRPYLGSDVHTELISPDGTPVGVFNLTGVGLSDPIRAEILADAASKWSEK